jgi:hypothetical protein
MVVLVASTAFVSASSTPPTFKNAMLPALMKLMPSSPEQVTWTVLAPVSGDVRYQIDAHWPESALFICPAQVRGASLYVTPVTSASATVASQVDTPTTRKSADVTV